MRAHPFVDVGADALHAAAIYALEFMERQPRPDWRGFPVETFIGVHLPGELYGFDRLRAEAVRALPFFFLWLGRAGRLPPLDAAALARRARDYHRARYAVTAPLSDSRFST